MVETTHKFHKELVGQTARLCVSVIAFYPNGNVQKRWISSDEGLSIEDVVKIAKTTLDEAAGTEK